MTAAIDMQVIVMRLTGCVRGSSGLGAFLGKHVARVGGGGGESLGYSKAVGSQ